MIGKKMYRYLGRNGYITSDVQLENISPIPMLEIRAEIGKILTNGVKKVYSTIIFEDELENWQEIDD
jgi:hypothetical protein